jgi:hypothetical protein
VSVACPVGHWIQRIREITFEIVIQSEIQVIDGWDASNLPRKKVSNETAFPL